jgi:O-antigen ligase
MSKFQQLVSKYSQEVVNFGIAIILILMPFHAFISVYLGYLGLNKTLVQSWKEILIILLAFAWLIYQASKKRLAFKFDTINILFITIIFLSFLITLINHPNSEAVLFGIKTNLVAIGLYFVAQIPKANKNVLKSKISLFVVVPALIVSILAILQTFVIKPDFLYRLGYGASTIDPKQIVDGSLGIYRAFSTLGGPNQLGAYLLVPLAFAIVYGIRQKKWFIFGASFPILIGIALSFSRSAWIGAIFTLLISIFIAVNKKQKIYLAVVASVVLVIMGVSVGVLATKNQKVQNVLLHGRYFENRIEGSDQNRLQAIADATTEIIASPFGHGLGSAGPASFKSDKPVIPENWYLQIAYEIGVIGLMLYILVFAGLMGEFIRDLKNPMAASLLAATIGILIINLFLQAWADSTLVLIVFALYGIYRSKDQ